MAKRCRFRMNRRLVVTRVRIYSPLWAIGQSANLQFPVSGVLFIINSFFEFPTQITTILQLALSNICLVVDLLSPANNAFRATGIPGVNLGLHKAFQSLSFPWIPLDLAAHGPESTVLLINSSINSSARGNLVIPSVKIEASANRWLLISDLRQKSSITLFNRKLGHLEKLENPRTRRSGRGPCRIYFLPSFLPNSGLIYFQSTRDILPRSSLKMTNRERRQPWPVSEQQYPFQKIKKILEGRVTQLGNVKTAIVRSGDAPSHGRLVRRVRRSSNLTNSRTKAAAIVAEQFQLNSDQDLSKTVDIVIEDIEAVKLAAGSNNPKRLPKKALSFLAPASKSVDKVRAVNLTRKRALSRDAE
ncbi:hypothetical protein C8J56DRAFT_880198 [Mycena floridula]|nr:hypothetical protein C8J56DRAFT_880198 [Mycena floridula]